MLFGLVWVLLPPAFTAWRPNGREFWRLESEAQGTYIVFTGSTVMLTRSIRRIDTDWNCHLGFYLHFNDMAVQEWFWWKGDSCNEIF
jgi:hypothetical protein